jgi:hypothetical protein
MLAELRKEILRSHSRLACHGLNLVVAEDTLQLLRRHRLVGSVADPGLCNMPQPGLLKARKNACQAAGGLACALIARLLAAAQQTHQYALDWRSPACAATHKSANNLIQ